MTADLTEAPGLAPELPGTHDVELHLGAAGWSFVDEDAHGRAWRPGVRARAGGPDDAPGDDLLLVLPLDVRLPGADEVLQRALRVIAWNERRTVDEVLQDIGLGGADVLAVRTHPKAAPGEIPLSALGQGARAVRELIVGAACALVQPTPDPVLPSRRPARAEAFADQVRVRTGAGSFVLSAALPLHDGADGPQDGRADADESTPFGRLVAARVHAVAVRALRLADEVAAGRAGLADFAEPAGAANVTELAALAALGGDDQGYDLRFALSPTVPARHATDVLTFTGGHLHILREAAAHLRTGRRRSGVELVVLVVGREDAASDGTGRVLVQTPDDDAGRERRYAVRLSAPWYAEAERAHRHGLHVAVTGDVTPAQPIAHLEHVSAFTVLPDPDAF